MAGKSKTPIVLRQPDDITCGPTCLHSIYDYYGEGITLDDVIKEVQMLRGGGTLGALLGTHALKRGYKAHLYTYNLKIFDPTWYDLPPKQLIAKLQKQMRIKKRPKFMVASKAYVEFLKKGGEVKFMDLTSALINGYLMKGQPLLAALSATYLYKSARETGKYPVSDDMGEPQGHFVVLTSYDPAANEVTVADPYHPESMQYGMTYRINMEHLICAILLGVMTYDGNLLVITKKKKG